jgi:hypothetical protein
MGTAGKNDCDGEMHSQTTSLEKLFCTNSIGALSALSLYRHKTFENKREQIDP